MNHEAVALPLSAPSVTERSARYLRHLLFFIFVATLFEGYDVRVCRALTP